MAHPTIPLFHVCLTEEDGRRIGALGFHAPAISRHLFINEVEFDVTGSDDPEDRPLGYTRFDRIGSAVWMDANGRERAVIFERAALA